MDCSQIAELLRPFLTQPIPPAASLAALPPADLSIPGQSGGSGESAFLSSSQSQNISTYIDILLRWNTRVNLTAVRRPEEIVTRHFGESLFAARCLFRFKARVEPGLRPGLAERSSPIRETSSANDQGPTTNDLIDFGSGAGFPGLPMKIWAPHLHLTLVESNRKKAVFLREVVRALILTDIDVFGGRAEDLTQRAQLVTLRAVERFDSALPVAAGLVAPGGTLALLIGQAQVDRTRQLLPSFVWLDPVPIPLSSARVVLAGFAP
jgi:16S rRNA (guanine527-N7)-methyltransferase